MKNKRILISGSYTVAVAAIVICVAVVANILVGLLPEEIRKTQTNPEEMPTIGKVTHALLDSLDTDITIYHLYSESITGTDEDGKEIVAPMDDKIANILEKYDKASDKIKLKTIDPVAYPDFMKKYTQNSYNQSSVIVESEKRWMFIDTSQMYRWTFKDLGSTEYLTFEEMYNLLYYYYSQGVALTPDNTYFFGENEITGAIDYVSRESIPVIYEMTGHDETALDGGSYDAYLTEVNAALETLTKKEDSDFAIPEGTPLFIINAPQKDISEKELEALKVYINAGGTVILTTDCNTYKSETMPNIAALCAYMGMKGIEELVVESTAYTGEQGSYGYAQYIDQIYARSSGKGILKNYTSPIIMVSGGHGISTVPDCENVEVTPLATTTENAYLYTEDVRKAMEDAMSITEEEEYYKTVDAIIKEAPKSAYDMACQSVLKDSEGNSQGTLYWFATSNALVQNSSFEAVFSLIVSDTCDTDESISLIGKEVGEEPVLEIEENEKEVWGIVLIGVIPVLCIIPGIILWDIRRRK